MRSDWFFLVLRVYHFLTDNLLQSESCAVAEKLHDAVVKFGTYRNLQRHRAVLLAIARLLFEGGRGRHNNKMSSDMGSVPGPKSKLNT